MKKIKILLYLLFLSSNIVNAGFFDQFLRFGGYGKSSKDENTVILTTIVQEKQHQLNILKKEKELLETGEKQFLDSIQNELNAVNARIEYIKNKLKEAPRSNQDFLNKVLSRLNEISQALIDIQLERKKLLNVVIQHIDFLEQYLKDSSFQSKVAEPKASYSFDTLDKLHKDIAASEEESHALNEERVAIEGSIESYKKELALLEKELKVKERDQKRFGRIKDDGQQEKLTLSQKSEIIDLDVQLLSTRKRLIELKLKEEQNKLALINTKLFLNDSILKIHRNSLPIVENALFVSELDVENINKNLVEKKRSSTELQTKYSQEIRQLSQSKEKLKDEFEKILKKYNITDVKALSDWSIDIKSIEFEPGIYEAGFLNDRIQTFDRNIVLKEAKKDLESEKIEAEDILVNIINSWYKISHRKFKSEDEIDAQRKSYEAQKNEINKKLSAYKDKINAFTNIINNQGRIHSNILEKVRLLNERQDKFIAQYGADALKKSMNYLIKSEEQINFQSELNNKIIENYSNIIIGFKESLRKINNILLKLENLGGVLLRSKYAISLENVKNIVPDLKQFFSDLNSVILSFFLQRNIRHSMSSAKQTSLNFAFFLNLLVQLILLSMSYFLLKRLLPYIYSLLLSIRPSMRSLYYVNCLLAVIIGFIILNFTSLFIWSVIFAQIKLGMIWDVRIKVLFYLFSIPYLCYLSHKFIGYLLEFNKKYNYLLLNPKFQKHFSYVFLFFMYSTIITFFFIEAFISITYGKSELPTILLALYSIIFRISLVLLIGKEEVLSIIPENEGVWLWLRKEVSRYYYLLLTIIIAIMVISDPYIGGFSKLVSFVLWGIVYTFLLFTALWWFQILVRRLSSTIFFKQEEDEAAKERFPYAKTFYGISSIASFLFFIFLAVFVLSKIWHFPVSFDKITEFLNVTIFSVRGEADQIIPITIKSFFVLFTFLFSGFVVAWAFERFVLRRIFDILLVDQGIQNTVSSITYYMIIIVILLVGLLRIGLSAIIPFLIGALAVGLAFAIKGPANDFIGYFIILVERSVKIGDYLEIDHNIRGVVRKITPRSVVIRKKNSTSIIVPNSQLTNTAFMNWNYVPGFIAVEDILLTVPFSSDPQEIIKLLLKVISQNPDILKSPAPVAWLDEFGENGYVLRFRAFLSSANILRQWDIASNLRLAMVKALREQGVQVASPVRRVIMTENSDKFN